MRSASLLVVGGDPPTGTAARRGRQVGDGDIGAAVELVEVEAEDGHVQSAEDRDLPVVPAALDPDEPVPERPAVGDDRARHDHCEKSHRHEEESKRAAAGGGATARRQRRCRRGWRGGRIGERRAACGRSVVDLALADVAAGGAVDHRLHERGTAATVVDDVGDDHRHVVGTTAAQGQLDEPVRGGLGIGVLERLGEGLLAHDAREAVGAQEVAVAGARLAHRQVGLDVLAVQGPQQQGALRMAVGLLGGDPAVVDQRLDERVVVRDLRELAVADQVGTGVTDVAQGQASAREEDRGERRPHALELWRLPDHLAQVLAALEDGLAQRLQHVAGGCVVVQVLQGGDDHLAGDVAGRVATHAVGDGQQPGPGVDRVLVVAADQPAIGPGRVAEDQAHASSSQAVEGPEPQRAVLNGELASSLTQSPRWRSSTAFATLLCSSVSSQARSRSLLAGARRRHWLARKLAHVRSSIAVWPMRIGWPGLTSKGPWTRCWSR